MKVKDKKPNPKKRPATMADVNQARQAGRDEALNCAMCIFLTVMLDKERATKEDIQRIWAEVNELSDSIAKSYVKVYDLRQVLAEEYDILV